MSMYLQGIIYQAQAKIMEAEAKIALQKMQMEAQRIKENADMVMSRRPPPPRPGIYATAEMLSYADVSQTIYNSGNYSEDDPRYVSNVHMSEKSKERLAEITRKKKEEEDRNMKMWGRKDDPRLDPTSEFFDPLKLVHKDVEDE